MQSHRYDCTLLALRKGSILKIPQGGAAFVGLGTYTYFSGHSQLRANEASIMKTKPFFGMASRRFGISSIAAVLVGAGLYRLAR